MSENAVPYTPEEIAGMREYVRQEMEVLVNAEAYTGSIERTMRLLATIDARDARIAKLKEALAEAVEELPCSL